MPHPVYTALPLLLALCCLSVGCTNNDDDTPTPTPTPSTHNEGADAVASFAIESQQEHGFVGVSVGAWTGDTLSGHAAGMASLEDERVVTFEDTFQVGSVHKMVTAVVTLQLIEEGAFGLETTVGRWAPGVPGASEITVRDLLGHSSGLADYTSSPDVLGDPSRPWSPEEVIAAAVDLGPIFAPGEGFAYSNTGYTLLGMIIEAETGVSWAAAQRERVLEPAGMHNSFFRGYESGQETCVGYFQMEEGAMATTGYVHPSLPGPAGSLVSDGEDLMRFMTALFGGDLLEDASLEAMLAPHRDAETLGGRAAKYGLGVYILEIAGLKVYGHDGGIPGFTSFMAYAPEADQGVVVMVNSEPGEAVDLGDAWLVDALDQ